MSGPAGPGTAPPEVVFAGVATWDTVAQLPRLPEADGRAVAEDVGAAGGGPAATAAVAAARLGLTTRLVAAVGEDDNAERIRAGLRAEGVDADGVTGVRGQPSGACVVLVDRPRASRSICVLPGPELRIEPGSPEAERVLSARWLHVDHAGLPAVEPLLASLPPDSPRPTVCYDAGNLRPRRCPAAVDVYVPTLAALREVYGGGTDGPGEMSEVSEPDEVSEAAEASALLAAARADGAHLVVATDGARGAYAAGPGGVHGAHGAHTVGPADSAYHVSAPTDIDVRSTLGAGDVFHGALLAALAREAPLPEALAYANAAAALSCRGLDGRTAIPDHAETRALAARIPAVPIEPTEPTEPQH